MRQSREGHEHDVYLVGVGGQGVLTIADLIAEAALEEGLDVNYYPTKGMAQRGGSVKAQVRIGREVIGPEIPEQSADLVIAMERSEGLKALRYVKPNGEFLLFGRVWEPTQVMLGKAAYPSIERVREAVREIGARWLYVDPSDLPNHAGRPVPANVYALGTAVGHTRLGDVLDPDDVARVVVGRWERYAAVNGAAFRAGLDTDIRGT